jgi:hypothetical protein
LTVYPDVVRLATLDVMKMRERRPLKGNRR